MKENNSNRGIVNDNRSSRKSTALLFLVVMVFGVSLGMFLTSAFFLQRQVVGQLSTISERLDKLNQTMERFEKRLETLSSSPQNNPDECVSIMLFYYNEQKDSELSDIPLSDERAVIPVCRCLPHSDNLIEETIRLLLKGDLTEKERAIGFRTEYPGESFELKEAVLSDRTLTLVFEDPHYFSSGGSARTFVMATEMYKTAQQFAEVEEVVFEPEWVFQP